MASVSTLTRQESLSHFQTSSTRSDEAYGSQIRGRLAQCFCPVRLYVAQRKKMASGSTNTLHWLTDHSYLSQIAEQGKPSPRTLMLSSLCVHPRAGQLCLLLPLLWPRTPSCRLARIQSWVPMAPPGSCPQVLSQDATPGGHSRHSPLIYWQISYQ